MTREANPVEISRSRETWVLTAMGILTLVPYAAFHGMFGRLYWFGDEFDLIDRMDRLGFWRWMWLTFAENFVPLFKALWGGSVVAFGGSYAAMILIVWLTHALNVVLLGRLMRSCGLSWVAVLSAQAVFGLTAANIETLAWSVQWSAVLSTTFMLLALDSFFRRPRGRAPIAWAVASALSFSRGILSGPMLSGACIWPPVTESADRFRRRAALAAAYLVPAVAVGLLIYIFADTGNQRHMTGHWGDAAMFGTWYYCLNPTIRVLGVGSTGPGSVFLLGFLKLALVSWTLSRSRGRERLLFVLLVAFDLGNAVLLGIGRFQTGLALASSSRYQYASLIGILPLAGYCLSKFGERLPAPLAVRRVVFAALLALAAVVMCLQWPSVLGPFSVWRGTDSRRVFLDEAGQGPQEVPGFAAFPMERAKVLIQKYNLH